LRPRVARLSRQHGDQVRTLRRRIATGEPLGDLGQQMPVVVVLEAMRREKVARDGLIAQLSPPPPPSPSSPPSPREPPKPRKGDVIDQCGLGFKMLTPLGLRFATAFTKGGDE